MGCDVHVVVEELPPGRAEGEGWDCLAGEYRLGRDYPLFALMAAGVRDWYGEAPGVPLRGAPEGPSGELQAQLRHWIYGEDGDGKGTDGHSLSWLLTAELAAVHELYRTELVELTEFEEVAEGDPRADPVFGPGWGTVEGQWFPVKKEGRAVREVRYLWPRGPNPEVEGLLALMRAREERGSRCRVVFWFDC